MRNKYLQFGLGMIVGGLLCGTTASAADYLTATVSTQRFYLNGQPVQLEAYAIHGNNFVKLRDIGRAVDFGVIYDGTTNSVYIDPNSPYQEEVKQTEQTTGAPSAVTEETVQAALARLKEAYPSGSLYGAPYVSGSGGPYSVSNTYCAGWAVKCSDAAFGSLPWRRVDRPSWDEIRPGDLVEYTSATTNHVVVVVRKTAEGIFVTESGLNNKTRWGGQYFRWWLEEQPEYILFTRYPQSYPAGE